MTQAANLGGADLLLVAIPNVFEAGQIAQRARAANPALKIIARAHTGEEIEHLRMHGADEVVMGERELARAMLARAKVLAAVIRPANDGAEPLPV